MNAVELEKELWEVNNALVKAGIKPYQYPSMADAVAELHKRDVAQIVWLTEVEQTLQDLTDAIFDTGGSYHSKVEKPYLKAVDLLNKLRAARALGGKDK